MSPSEPSDTTTRSSLATLGVLCAGEPTAAGSRPADPETSGGGHDSGLLVQLEVDVEQLSLNTTSGSRQDSPILHIPFEIAAEIFVLHTEGIYNAVDYDVESESARSAPYRLAAVCRTWRAIALMTPQLWTTINIFISSIERLPLLAELAEDWMTRSGQLPLNISLSVSSLILNTMDANLLEEGMVPLFRRLRRFAPRWRQLILIDVPTDFYEDLTGFALNVPLLDDLRLTPFRSQESARFHIVEAPRLKHLEISGLYVYQIDIPWQNLTSMEVTCVYVDEIFELLKSADRLTFAKFSDLCGDGDIFPLPENILIHHSLKSLDLRPGGGGDVTGLNIFLDNILFPSLESFIYHPMGSFPVNNLLALFRNSESPITRLEIVVPKLSEFDPGVTEGELVRLLEGIPTITTLSVSLLSEHLATIITDYFFHRLAGPSILPHLEVLRFMGWRGFRWSCVADLLFANAGYGLKFRLIDIKVDLPRNENDKIGSYIDKYTLSLFDRLAPQNPKTTLNIVVADTGMDFIAASLAAPGGPVC